MSIPPGLAMVVSDAVSLLSDGKNALTPQDVKVIVASAFGFAVVSGAMYFSSRRHISSRKIDAHAVDEREKRSSSSNETKHEGLVIDTLSDLLQYNSGGIFCDVVTRIITPRVTAIRVTGHGSRLSSLPRPVCNLVALTELDISYNSIKFLPREILKLKALKKLNVSGNKLTELPEEIGSLTELILLNAMDNELEVLPESLGSLSKLEILGLKSNRIKYLPDSIGNLKELKQLYLTDNELESLTEQIGGCRALIKLQASHNALTSLPGSLGALPNLELLRVSCCNIESIPIQLAESKSLSWLSLASNPLARLVSSPRRGSLMPSIRYEDVTIERKIGDGASGEVFEALWKNKERVAVKIFRSDSSPDGHSRDEIMLACMLQDRNLVHVLARMEEPLGLVMEYVEGKPLAEKPNSSSLLRCRWKDGEYFSLKYALRILVGVASAVEHMHSRGVAHGDIYAHNVLVGEKDVILCDYGASFMYPRGSNLGTALEGHDIRAFGLFMRDVVGRLDISFDDMELSLSSQKELLLLIQQCTSNLPSHRPRMSVLSRKLRSIQKAASSAVQGQSLTPRSDSRLMLKQTDTKGLRNGLATAR